ncbi:phosphoglycerate dehydrogenase [Nocardioides psychrotolerans]|nr:phosphoglycerate dehydrogenase [Nocardioides psychrotolerans]
MQAELPVHLPRLLDAGFEVMAPPLTGQQFLSSELAPMMSGVQGVIAGDDQLDRSFFESSPDLRVLIRWGIGMDSVDHDAAEAHGVVVRNTPGVFGGEVADSAFAYLLMLARRHHQVDVAVREGHWPKVEGTSLRGSTLGVVGLGVIGQAMVDRAHGFGMDVRGFDPYLPPERAPHGVTIDLDLHVLLQESRFVVLTCPLTRETFHLIDDGALRSMRSDGLLVNVARGPVVDEVALVAALERGGIAGAGLDVFEVEPLPETSRLRRMDNVILGAHNGSNTREGVARASARAVDILLEELGSR